MAAPARFDRPGPGLLVGYLTNSAGIPSSLPFAFHFRNSMFIFRWIVVASSIKMVTCKI